LVEEFWEDFSCPVGARPERNQLRQSFSKFSLKRLEARLNNQLSGKYERKPMVAAPNNLTVSVVIFPTKCLAQINEKMSMAKNITK